MMPLSEFRRRLLMAGEYVFSSKGYDVVRVGVGRNGGVYLDMIRARREYRTRRGVGNIFQQTLINAAR